MNFLTKRAKLYKLKYVLLAILMITIIAYYAPFKTRLKRAISMSKTSETPKHYLVLLWTPYFANYKRWPKMEDLKCKYRNCELTQDRRLFNVSDALVFHWTHADIKASDLPAYHNPNQMWIILNQESPNRTPYNAILPIVEQINWTMTYRRDSDIFAPYGEIVKCDNSARNTVNVFKAKKRNIAWIVSHCHTHSKREDYVRELQQYIDVDIYGGCGKLRCDEFIPNTHPLCLKNISRDYKFYLSFENSICLDYVTEKLFNVAQYDIIPIVRGGADYRALMPYNSYIDAFNFSSPKQLAEYLHIVGSDPIKYNSYMTWKNNYCSVFTGWDVFCNMCETLNNPQYTIKKTSLIDWWFQDGNCSVNAHEW